MTVLGGHGPVHDLPRPDRRRERGGPREPSASDVPGRPPPTGRGRRTRRPARAHGRPAAVRLGRLALARALRGLSRVLLLPDVQRAAFDQAARGRDRLGPGDRRRDARLDPARPALPDAASVRELAARIRCPVLVMHGSADAVRPHDSGAAFAELIGAAFVTLEGAGHGPEARDPVKVNLLVRGFAERAHPSGSTGGAERRVWTRGRSRRKRALYISSPIGLGHAQRDVAFARELRTLHPDLEIDWLARFPVTNVLAAEGERIHPASAYLANESRHIESESAEHDLHCFHAWRRMDEILVSNFMVFHDLVASEQYDLWIGDEAWELDYYLHENPELKRAAYVWLTDFVGWLPMEDGDPREADLTADYNAEMIEHIARYRRVRDRALFVGNPDDIVP